MDHLPLPVDPMVGSFEVPFLCTSEYDDGPFESYAERNGWTIEFDERLILTKNREEVTDDSEIGALVQTWLYIGLLSDITGMELKRSMFQKRAGSGIYVFSSQCLESIVAPWSERVAKAEWAYDIYKLNDYVQTVVDRLEIAQDFMTRLAESRVDSDHVDEMPLFRVILSVAVLWEYIAQSIKQIYTFQEYEPSARANWRFSTDECSEPLRRLMLQSGWCPNKLAYFEQSESASNGMMWYYANIDPPRTPAGHQGCTSQQCKSFQVDLKDYQTQHLEEGCTCPFLQTPSAHLASIASANDVPLVSFEDGVLHIRRREPGSRSVAISHVWADGFGNQTHNALPCCVISYIQNCVNAALDTEETDGQNIPFWIDTLCLPRKPRALRNQAIQNIALAFRHASRVLVLDRYLRSLNSASMCAIELTARVKAAPWTSRLWTYLEGRLATKVSFQFQDLPVDLYERGIGWVKAHPTIPALASYDVELGIRASYSASKIMAIEDEIEDIDLPFMRVTLSTRSTSWAPDEGLCIGGILGLPMKALIDAESSDKMRVLWSMIEKIPSGIVFSRAKQKLTNNGFRWAPASFMSEVEEPIESWIGPSTLWEIFARRSPNGIRVTLPSAFFERPRSQHASHNSQLAKRMLFESFLPESLEQSHEPIEFLRLRCSRGLWYKIELEDDWHQEPLAIDFHHDLPALVLSYSLYHPYIRDSVGNTTKLSLGYADPLRGILVTYHSHQSRTDPIVARAHRHVRVHLLPPSEQELANSVQECAKQILQVHGKKIDKVKLRDPQDLPDKLRPWVKKVAKQSRLWDLCKSDLIEQGGDCSEKSVLQICLQKIYYLIWMDHWYSVVENEEQVTWCID